MEDFSFKTIDLFAGIGGMRLGFERIGGQCVFTSEWDKFAVKTYQENFPQDKENPEHISAGDITMTQPGGYSFPKLSNAGTIDLKDTYETTVAHVSFPALTTATAVQTNATGTMEVIFTYATNVDFGALATAPSNTITITTKKIIYI